MNQPSTKNLPVPTTDPCIPYMPTLTPKTTPSARQMRRSHGDLGFFMDPLSVQTCNAPRKEKTQTSANGCQAKIDRVITPSTIAKRQHGVRRTRRRLDAPLTALYFHPAGARYHGDRASEEVGAVSKVLAGDTCPVFPCFACFGAR